jgi:hypothetical protein
MFEIFEKYKCHNKLLLKKVKIPFKILLILSLIIILTMLSLYCNAYFPSHKYSEQLLDSYEVWINGVKDSVFIA